MHRQHASVATSTSTSLNEAEPELNAETNPLFEIGPVELDQMRDETCPRISAADVINLGKTRLSTLTLSPDYETIFSLTNMYIKLFQVRTNYV